MRTNPRLLVVDDEEVVCQGCQRVLSRQGFHVETTNEAQTGLTLASEKDYAAIVLDITMPQMDGIEFLERLRQRKPDVPVIFITGHPSIPNAASAVRLRAADYITKPFTPETITQSVQRLVKQRPEAPAVSAMSHKREVEQWVPQAEGLRFWDESWLQPADNGEIRVGALLGRSAAAAVQSVRLPGMGEALYQGLPMAGLVLADGSLKTVPAPISGVVSAVNSSLGDYPASLADLSQRGNWVATIAPTRLEDEQTRCRFRRVLLLNANPASAEDQSAMLTAMGCQVVVSHEWKESLLRGQAAGGTMVVIHAASFADRGPDLVGRVHAEDPSAKVIVVAGDDSRHESAYRLRGIFYYALNPFADGEIVDILDGAFRQPAGAVVNADGTEGGADGVSKICITNRNRTKVCLLVENGLMQKDHGLGRQVRRALFDRAFPVEITLGTSSITPIKVLKAAGACQRVIVLLARDSGHLPGTVAQHPSDYVQVIGRDSDRIATLVIQPDPARPGLLKFDERTTAMLADHIVRQMATM